jgi:hypothetical protein
VGPRVHGPQVSGGAASFAARPPPMPVSARRRSNFELNAPRTTNGFPPLPLSRPKRTTVNSPTTSILSPFAPSTPRILLFLLPPPAAPGDPRRKEASAEQRNKQAVASRVVAAAMGQSGKWIKSLVGLKATEKAAGSKGRKWARLWRSSSSASSRAGDGATLASQASSDSFSSVVAAVVRAPPRDFRLIRQEWAAVRIQTAFRAFLVTSAVSLSVSATLCGMVITA